MAGEDIRVCERDDIGGISPDFWLFDDKYIQVLDYDNSGNLVGKKTLFADRHCEMIERVRELFDESRRLKI